MTQRWGIEEAAVPAETTNIEDVRAENRRLRGLLDDLMGRVEMLEERLAPTTVPATAPTAAPAPALTESTSRRWLLTRGGVMAAGTAAAYMGMVMAKPKVAAADSGKALIQFMDFSPTPVTPPALDTGVRWMRKDPVGVQPYYTNQILSLVSDNSQTNSFAWPLYIELRGTNSAAANQGTSQSVGSTVRTYNRSTGSPWIAGYHSETIHGAASPEGPSIAANGSTILFNGEVNRRTTNGQVVGLNLQNTEHSVSNADVAIQIQSASGPGGIRGWNDGIRFQGTGGIAGNIGINFGSTIYNMGLDLGSNSLRMNANQKIILEGSGSVWIQYNSASGRVELHKGYQFHNYLD